MVDDGSKDLKIGVGTIVADGSKAASAAVAGGVAGTYAPWAVVGATAAAKIHSTYYTKEDALKDLERYWPSEQPAQQLPLYVLAALANDAYQEQSRLPKDVKFCRTPRPEEKLDLPTKVRVYQHEEQALAVIAIRGTFCLSSACRDLKSLCGSAYPGNMIITIAKMVKDLQAAGNHVMVTGHSLGGYLAEIAATTFKLGGAGFCAPGPGEHNDAEDWKWFCTINHEGDTIGNLMW